MPASRPAHAAGSTLEFDLAVAVVREDQAGAAGSRTRLPSTISNASDLHHFCQYDRQHLTFGFGVHRLPTAQAPAAGIGAFWSSASPW